MGQLLAYVHETKWAECMVCRTRTPTNENGTCRYNKASALIYCDCGEEAGYNCNTTGNIYKNVLVDLYQGTCHNGICQDAICIGCSNILQSALERQSIRCP